MTISRVIRTTRQNFENLLDQGRHLRHFEWLLQLTLQLSLTARTEVQAGFTPPGSRDPQLSSTQVLWKR